MIKLSSYALTAALLTNAAHLASAECIDGTISTFSGTCSYATFLGGLTNGCTETDFAASVPTDMTAEEYVNELCQYDAPTPFVEIQGTYQKDRRYFAGGGNLVDGTDWSIDSARISRFNTNLGSKTLIAFPEYAARMDYNEANGLGENGYPTNMNLESGCELNTIMCCFTDDSTLPSNTFLENDDSTTDVCRHDLELSPQSNHIKYGWSAFPGSETSTHCTGFTWTDGNEELLGNMMYDVSLKNTIEKGYRRGVPGAPMCGCIEHMPVVEEASCRTASVVGDVTYTFTLDGVGTEDADVSVSNSADITYSDCTDSTTDAVISLAAQFKANQATKDDEAKIDEHLVGSGNCDADVSHYLNEDQFLVDVNTHVNRYTMPDTAKWSELVVGEGAYFLPPEVEGREEIMDTYFRDLVNAGCKNADDTIRPCIVRRVCASCDSAPHRDIYYKRTSPIPPYGATTDGDKMYFLDMFMSQWYHTPANRLNEDFELYSTYEDALAGTNKWEYCDYNDGPTQGFGFPRNCGPKWKTWNQWNSYVRGGGHADHHGYYVELPPASP